MVLRDECSDSSRVGPSGSREDYMHECDYYGPQTLVDQAEMDVAQGRPTSGLRGYADVKAFDER
jgi:hypothetical protein